MRDWIVDLRGSPIIEALPFPPNARKSFFNNFNCRIFDEDEEEEEEEFLLLLETDADEDDEEDDDLLLTGNVSFPQISADTSNLSPP